MGRTDTASKVIRASAQKIYAAHVDPQAVAQWRPPRGMRAEVYSFDARAGGGYRMALVHEDASVPGKTSANADVFSGQFVELVPGERIVERVVFKSDDPAYADYMTVTTTLTPTADGTRVDIVCENVPDGISAADHQVGMASTLANLAAFVERP
jgi:uncharacterized protein YndB with AHSA1/START domain